VVILQLG